MIVLSWISWPFNCHYYHTLFFAYPFPDVAAYMDVLYIRRYCAIRLTLQTLAPIKSATSFSQHIFDIRFHMFFSRYLLIIVLIYPVFGVFLYVRHNMDWFVLFHLVCQYILSIDDNTMKQCSIPSVRSPCLPIIYTCRWARSKTL